MSGLYTTQDIYLTNDGDFAVSSTGDLRYATASEDVRQEAIILLYTPVGEFGAFPTLGSRLVNFIGEANTRSTASLIKQEIERALTQYGGFAGQDISTDIIPIAPDEILINLDIVNILGFGGTTISIEFNYIKGIQIRD